MDGVRTAAFFRFCRRVLLLCLLAVLPALPLLSAGAEKPVLKENAWNYVEVSLDVSGGIPEDAEGRLALIRQRGVLRVATEPYFPPQEYIDESRSGQEQYQGADMDLARLIAQRMGVELEIIPMDFSDVLLSVVGSKCDLAIAALSYTPARAESVELSKGYHYADDLKGSSLLVREAEKDLFPDMKSLENKILAAQQGTLQESQAADNIQYYLEFRRFSTVDDIYAALQSGEADAAVVETENTRSWLEAHPDSGLCLLPNISFKPSTAEDGHRVAAKKGEIELIAFVNGVIDEVLSSGQYDTWMAEHIKRLSD